MELTVTERLVAQGLLPQEANFTNLKLIRVAREGLSFSDEENKALQFKQDGEQVQWNQEAAELLKDVELGEVVTIMIVDALKELDKDNKLQEQHFSLYSKFVD